MPRPICATWPKNQTCTVAEAEKLKRDALGDELTTGEKVESGANELKNRTQAEIDKAKRELRDRA